MMLRSACQQGGCLGRALVVAGEAQRSRVGRAPPRARPPAGRAPDGAGGPPLRALDPSDSWRWAASEDAQTRNGSSRRTDNRPPRRAASTRPRRYPGESSSEEEEEEDVSDADLSARKFVGVTTADATRGRIKHAGESWIWARLKRLSLRRGRTTRGARVRPAGDPAGRREAGHTPTTSAPKKRARRRHRRAPTRRRRLRTNGRCSSATMRAGGTPLTNATPRRSERYWGYPGDDGFKDQSGGVAEAATSE